MKVQIARQTVEIEICTQSEAGGGADEILCRIEIADAAAAQAFLSRYPLPHEALAQLRALLAGDNPAVARQSDHALAEEIARRLGDGRLVAVSTAMRLHPMRVSKPEPAAAPTPRSARPAPASAPAPEPEQADNVDHDTQAETLEEASEDGTPFCEECEKRKKEREAAAAA